MYQWKKILLFCPTTSHKQVYRIFGEKLTGYGYREGKSLIFAIGIRRHTGYLGQRLMRRGLLGPLLPNGVLTVYQYNTPTLNIIKLKGHAALYTYCRPM